ncbi:phBC6A51 family helix-turn-helix protein [Paraliobacillus sp. X-1268]|uniref:phBC6A51 family helix-turn-helix protein n=1 Tax=Paraliobacillus sp. X-1268 TaxID=2213193 RepID=UPI000E3B702F|nr:phBC6A51 family helix-turn-helix protein [Paraliobacillus sp. X-1268]
MLDNKKLLAIELLADGQLTKTDIAKKIGSSRQIIYNWLENEEFRAELDKRLHNRKVSVQKTIDGKLEFVMDKLYELANDDSNKRVQAQVLQYLADRSLGKATSKVELSTNINNNSINDDILEVEYDQLIEGNQED